MAEDGERRKAKPLTFAGRYQLFGSNATSGQTGVTLLANVVHDFLF